MASCEDSWTTSIAATRGNQIGMQTGVNTRTPTFSSVRCAAEGPRLRLTMLLFLAAICWISGAQAQTSPASAPGQVQVSGNGDGSSAPGASDSDLAKKLQNPIGDLISVPFQNNLNFNVGPHKGTQNILNIQPVIPFHLNDDWNLITRTILPLIWSPSNAPGRSVPFGLGPTTFTAFLSPRVPTNGWLWGAGPITQLPSATDLSLGSSVWGLGPAAVIVKTAGPIVAGVLVNNVFSLGGTSGIAGSRYSLLTINPFFNYNFNGGWFVGSVPIITANWDAPGAKWTVPVGLQGGRLVKLGGKLPVNMLLGAYYNPIRPAYGATWQLRAQVAFIF